MEDKKAILLKLLETDDGIELLYELAINTPDIVFGLFEYSKKYERVEMDDSFKDLRALSMKINKLAHETGVYDNF